MDGLLLILLLLIPPLAFLIPAGVCAYLSRRFRRRGHLGAAKTLKFLALAIVVTGVPVIALLFARPLKSQEVKSDWRYELLGNKGLGYETRLYFKGKELLRSSTFPAVCKLSPGADPLAAVCHAGSTDDPESSLGRYAIFVKIGNSVVRHDLISREIGVFSFDGSAYYTEREVFDLLNWRSIPLPKAIPEQLWPPTDGFSSPQFVGPSPGAQSFLWFQKGESQFEFIGPRYEFHLTDLVSGKTLQSFTVSCKSLPLPYALNWQDGAPEVMARFAWTKSPEGIWSTQSP